VVCAGLVGIVQESIWAVEKSDSRRIDRPLRDETQTCQGPTAMAFRRKLASSTIKKKEEP
jgi:hypothetical protein